MFESIKNKFKKKPASGETSGTGTHGLSMRTGTHTIRGSIHAGTAHLKPKKAKGKFIPIIITLFCLLIFLEIYYPDDEPTTDPPTPPKAPQANKNFPAPPQTSTPKAPTEKKLSRAERVQLAQEQEREQVVEKVAAPPAATSSPEGPSAAAGPSQEEASAPQEALPSENPVEEDQAFQEAPEEAPQIEEEGLAVVPPEAPLETPSGESLEDKIGEANSTESPGGAEPEADWSDSLSEAVEDQIEKAQTKEADSSSQETPTMQVNRRPLEEALQEFEVPPDYSFYGRGLVYNCKGGHWACLDQEHYQQCRKNFQWSQDKGELPSCVPMDVYRSNEDCGKVQMYNVNMIQKVPFCF